MRGSPGPLAVDTSGDQGGPTCMVHLDRHRLTRQVTKEDLHAWFTWTSSC